MANIASLLAKIKSGVYGEDVRGAIHDAIKAVNDSIPTSTNVSTEVADARTNTVTGEESTSLGRRLDADYTVLKRYVDQEDVPGDEAHVQILNATVGYTDLDDRLSTIEANSARVDPTLSVLGKAADAKKTGEAIANLRSDLEYVPIEISSFSITPNTDPEYDRTITSIACAYSLNIVPTEATINGESCNLVKTGTKTLSVSITSDTSYTLSVKDSGSYSHPVKTVTASAAIVFKPRIHWGVATIPASITSSFVTGLSGSALSTTRVTAFTVNAGANQYIWFAIPTSFGTPTFKVGGFDGGFTKVGTITKYARNLQYDVYRSDNPNLGSTTVTVS